MNICKKSNDVFTNMTTGKCNTFTNMYAQCFQVWSVDEFVGAASSNQSEAAVHPHQQTPTSATLSTGDIQTCST